MCLNMKICNKYYCENRRKTKKRKNCEFNHLAFFYWLAFNFIDHGPSSQCPGKPFQHLINSFRSNYNIYFPRKTKTRENRGFLGLAKRVKRPTESFLAMGPWSTPKMEQIYRRASSRLDPSTHSNIYVYIYLNHYSIL